MKKNLSTKAVIKKLKKLRFVNLTEVRKRLWKKQDKKRKQNGIGH